MITPGYSSGLGPFDNTPTDIDNIDYIGKAAADAFADKGAALTATTSATTASAALGIDFLRGRATKVLKRLVEIQRAISIRLDEVKSGLRRPKPEPRNPLLLTLLHGADDVFALTQDIYIPDQIPPLLCCLRCKGSAPHAGNPMATAGAVLRPRHA